MKYAGPSIVSTHQVGSVKRVIEGDVIRIVNIVSTETIKIGAGAVETFYYTAEFPGRRFAASEIYADDAAAKSFFSSLTGV